MFKKILILVAICCSAICHASIEDPLEPLQVGRYQIVSTSFVSDVSGLHNFQLHLLDTATGQVWKSGLKKNWSEHDAWIPQIHPLIQ